MAPLAVSSRERLPSQETSLVFRFRLFWFLFLNVRGADSRTARSGVIDRGLEMKELFISNQSEL